MPTALGVRCLVLFSVFMMRWNVVIGGQEISKTGKGLLHYEPTVFGKEGLIVAVLLTIAPVGLLYILTRLFPPWHDEPFPHSAAVGA